VSSRNMGWCSGLVLLFLRSLLLWFVIPLGFIVWIFVFPLLHDRGVALIQFLSWLDNNLIVLIQRGLLRPFGRYNGPNWIPAGRMSEVKHRLKWNDAL
jgi:hypothetical protein